jgi:hypothetical protein
VLGVDGAGVLVAYERLHYAEHVALTGVNEHFLIALIRLFDEHIAVVGVVDPPAAGKVLGDGHRIFTQFARDSAVVGNAVRGAIDDPDEVLPARERAHDLLGSTADRRWRIIRMEGE